MKRTIRLVILIMGLVMLLAGCGKKDNASETPTPTESEKNLPTYTVTGSVSPTEAPKAGKTLVVYFSATGNTKNVAEMIAKTEEADIWEIIPEQPYSKEDINYQDYGCRALKEQNDKSARPAIAGEKIDLSGYDKIYIGYPIWATQEPRIMDTFVEAYDFGTATVIPFCTSGSSGIGTTGTRLANLAGSGNWKPGKRFPANATEEDVRKWIESLSQ